MNGHSVPEQNRTALFWSLPVLTLRRVARGSSTNTVKLCNGSRVEEKGLAIPQSYISVLHTMFGAVETVQAVQQKSVTTGAPISASALEKFTANQEHDIINALCTQPSADVCLQKPFLIIPKSNVLQSVTVQ